MYTECMEKDKKYRLSVAMDKEARNKIAGVKHWLEVNDWGDLQDFVLQAIEEKFDREKAKQEKKR